MSSARFGKQQLTYTMLRVLYALCESEEPITKEEVLARLRSLDRRMGLVADWVLVSVTMSVKSLVQRRLVKNESGGIVATMKGKGALSSWVYEVSGQQDIYRVVRYTTANDWRHALDVLRNLLRADKRLELVSQKVSALQVHLCLEKALGHGWVNRRGNGRGKPPGVDFWSRTREGYDLIKGLDSAAKEAKGDE